MFIQNVSYDAIECGNHADAGPRAYLIQIIGPEELKFPVPKFRFERTFQFRFSDVDEKWVDVLKDAVLMTQDQAEDIAEILKNAKAEERNVIVHCIAGICRSGAVAEVGTMMGFEDVGNGRIPNVYVKKLLMKELGLGLRPVLSSSLWYKKI